MADFSKTIDQLMKKEGEMRGEILLSHLQFVERKEGADAVERINRTFQELGHEVDFSKIKAMGWVKVSTGTAIAIFGKELFDWKDEDIVKMGTLTPKIITINKFFLRHLVSVDSLLEKAGNYWEKACRVGTMEGKKYKNGKVVLQLKDYDFHPVDCLFISGYIKTIFDLCTEKEVEVIEEKCIHKGDNYHQFALKEK